MLLSKQETPSEEKHTSISYYLVGTPTWIASQPKLQPTRRSDGAANPGRTGCHSDSDFEVQSQLLGRSFYFAARGLNNMSFEVLAVPSGRHAGGRIGGVQRKVHT